MNKIKLNKNLSNNRRPSIIAVRATLCIGLTLGFGVPALAEQEAVSPAAKAASQMTSVPAAVAALEASPATTQSGTAVINAVAAPATGSLPAVDALEQASHATFTPMVSGEAISSDIDNFEVVSKGLWRGAQPSHKAIEKLAKGGVRTIIDLRYPGSGVDEEAIEAKQLGMNYVNIPFGFEHPSLTNVARFLAIVAKPTNQPVFLHCRQGADRTGTLVGIFRILHDHWSFSQAYNEMRTHHFKPWLGNLKNMVARCEVDPKLTKELADLTKQLESPETATKVSVKPPQVSL